MQGRSWMAALTLVASMAGAFAPPIRAAEPPPVKQKVNLSINVAGLSAKGGEIEIKPGNAGCRFETIKFQTKNHPRKTSDGWIILDSIDVETLSADRNCSFSITLKEAGQPDKNVRRILRITSAVEGKPLAPQSLTCFISSNSLAPVVAAKPDEAKRQIPVVTKPDETQRKK
jgi:hypothetical protein